MSLQQGPLRAVARIAAIVGAAGSAGFLLRSGQNPTALLLIIMLAWVLAPFLTLLTASIVSRRWPMLTWTALHAVMLAVAVGSLAVYLSDALWPRKSQPAFVFVTVPLASWIFAAIVIPIAAFLSGRRSRGA